MTESFNPDDETFIEGEFSIQEFTCHVVDPATTEFRERRGCPVREPEDDSDSD